MLQFPGLQIVHVVWDGPRNFSDAMQLIGDQDYGLYALYGTHTILGPEALLYIGKANASRFGQRLRGHYDEWVRNAISEITVYVGRTGS
jgi:hypothetical protein